MVCTLGMCPATTTWFKKIFAYRGFRYASPTAGIQPPLRGYYSLSLKRFMRFEMGEGLEKRNDNFAEEVAAQMKK